MFSLRTDERSSTTLCRTSKLAFPSNFDFLCKTPSSVVFCSSCRVRPFVPAAVVDPLVSMFCATSPATRVKIVRKPATRSARFHRMCWPSSPSKVIGSCASSTSRRKDARQSHAIGAFNRNSLTLNRLTCPQLSKTLFANGTVPPCQEHTPMTRSCAGACGATSDHACRCHGRDQCSCRVALWRRA